MQYYLNVINPWDSVPFYEHVSLFGLTLKNVHHCSPSCLLTLYLLFQKLLLFPPLKLILPRQLPMKSLAYHPVCLLLS